MKANPLTPAEIFGNQIRYVVPLFQRPYVWEEAKQWAPLWEDVQAVAERVLDTPKPTYGPYQVPPHFLGAVVVEQQHVGVNYISVRGIVDGQQRLTTLQLLLDAAQQVVAKYGDPQDAQALDVLVLNPAQLSPHKDERFKVWPTNRDQDAFRAAMDDDLVPSTELAHTRIVKAHNFFTAQIREWADVTGDPDKVKTRLNALTIALRDFLKLVVIDLEPGDNAQVIFETLNYRGTPLLAADLIKNLIFQTALAQGLDVNELYATWWADFDGDYWRQQISQGRLYRPRIDVFVNYWLILTLRREVATDRVFVDFRDYLLAPESPPLHDIVTQLVRAASLYRNLENEPEQSRLGLFRYRVLQTLGSYAVTPFLLWILAAGPDVPPDQRDKALSAMESWQVRRALCRFTAKGVNQLVLDLIKALATQPVEQAGDVTEAFLAGQTADARLWPTDKHVEDALTRSAVYLNLGKARQRVLLEALEDDLRAEDYKAESEPCPRGLTIEHLMPQAWKTYWPLPDRADQAAVDARDAAVHTLGNLTLVTKALNPSMSNGPWDDASAEAVGLPEGKRSALLHSVLLLNNQLTKYNTWSEADIETRGRELVTRANRIWSRPAATEAAMATEVAAEADDAAITDPEVDANTGKYASLYDWLKSRPEPYVSATFGDIESALGFALPPSSRNHLTHWYSYDGSAVARAIIDAGWKATNVDLVAETVTFVRVI